MGRNLFQLFFGKSVPLEPFPVLDTTNYLGVKKSAPGFKKKKNGKSNNHPTSHLQTQSGLKFFPWLLTSTAPMAKTSSPTIPVKGMR